MAIFLFMTPRAGLILFFIDRFKDRRGVFKIKL
jgi:hypothetical protein